jgi:predicted GIY-YIG superfamily endonuclease
VQRNSIANAAKSASKKNPGAKAFTYTASLPGGKKYCGYTSDPARRLSQHMRGTGARVTQELPPTGFTITPHRSVSAAKKMETKTYHSLKAKHGVGNVRGAGNTARYSMQR